MFGARVVWLTCPLVRFESYTEPQTMNRAKVMAIAVSVAVAGALMGGANGGFTDDEIKDYWDHDCKKIAATPEPKKAV